MTRFSFWIVSLAKNIKNVLRLFCKQSYSLVAIDSWSFLRIHISIFTSQKSSKILG